jgi:hypothetical protein
MNALFRRAKMRRLAALLVAAGAAASTHADDSLFTSRSSISDAAPLKPSHR